MTDKLDNLSKGGDRSAVSLERSRKYTNTKRKINGICKALSKVGGITFSSSVLQNISGVSIYRLLIVIDLLAFVLINVIYLLIKFIFVINNKNASLLKVERINVVCLLIAASILAAWFFNLLSLADFIAKFLPWCK